MKQIIRNALLLSCIVSLWHTAQAQTKDPAPAVGSTGKVTFTYSGKPLTLSTVRAKDGNIWLQQNLGSTKVASAVDDKEAYGDLFQWGRWDDGHQARTPVFSSHKTVKPNNPGGLDKSGQNPYLYAAWLDAWWAGGKENSTWTAATPQDATETNGCDPCKALGEGWHLPSPQEWETVTTAEDITDASSNMRSNLKLSFGGYRDAYGVTMYSEDSYGAYWTSTPHMTGYGKLFCLTMQGIKPKQTIPRGAGLSIRCLKSSL